MSTNSYAEYSDDDLIGTLTERYKPSVIPPCPVCGGKLSIASVGGGEPTRWACSIQEDDPDRPGWLRTKEGRGTPDEFSPEGHYRLSGYVDRRQGGDSAVMELIERYTKRLPR